MDSSVYLKGVRWGQWNDFCYISIPGWLLASSCFGFPGSLENGVLASVAGRRLPSLGIVILLSTDLFCASVSLVLQNESMVLKCS